MTSLESGAEPRFKPLDFGGQGITGSLDVEGCLIALNAYHPAHGYVTLTTAGPFPEADRYNPAAVRAYRAGLARLSGFGFRAPSAVRHISTRHRDTPLPGVVIETVDGTLEIDTGVYQGSVYQRVTADGLTPIWSGRLSLMRCAYTQLTEGGPVPMPKFTMRARLAAGRLLIEAPTLPAAVLIEGFADSEMWALEANSPVDVRIAGQPGESLLRYTFGLSAEDVERRCRDVPLTMPPFTELRREWHDKLADMPPDRVLRRGLLYSLLMAVPHGNGTCLLTDHMLLPLSWNRDAYYLARALLAWHANRAEAIDVVRRHLHWMWVDAERQDGFWGRCYLANGKIKDAAFQLDQQLFPVLELTDYAVETGDADLLRARRPAITALMDRLLARRHAERLLFPTDETPADDPIALPYHFSSHVLLWRVWRQMARLDMPGDWAALADQLRQEIDSAFITPDEGRRLYAYATDGAGRYHVYHDANDFPLALAPAWGFCAADDACWQDTVQFAFSDSNVGGVYDGRLGSVHTRAPWPLGDIQEWIIARVLGDTARATRAQQRLHASAQWDGALPEACHPVTGEVVSRHWFAWPNAAYACAALGAFTP